jgi:hypothetical protein
MKTVTVAAPLCSPARHWITKVREQFKPYHPSHLGVQAREVAKKCIEIDVTFTDEYAAWGEYILLRYGYQPVSQLINQKNRLWAQKYLDLAAAGASWVAPGCGKQQKGAYVGELGASAPPPAWEQQQPRPRRAGLLDVLRELFT